MSPTARVHSLDVYQADALRTAGVPFGPGLDLPQFLDSLVLAALGVAGEGGEFVDLVKKVAYHGRPLDKAKALEELGDLLWYVSLAARLLGFDLSTVATSNLEKLRARYPDGFSPEASAQARR